MLTRSVRSFFSSVLYSLTVLWAFIQPLPAFGQAGLQPFSAPLDALLKGEGFSKETRIELVEHTTEQHDHSWYPDIIVHAKGSTEIVLVLPLETVTPAVIEVLPYLPDQVETVIVAPRSDRIRTAEVVRNLRNPDDQTAVVYRFPGEESRWQLAVEGRVTPVWLAQAVTRTDILPFSTVLVNTARLGLGRREPILKAALDNGQVALGLNLADDRLLPDVLAALTDAIALSPVRPNRPVEQNYLIAPLTIGGAPNVIIPESTLIWSITAVATLMVLVALARPRRIRLYALAIRHNFLLFTGVFLLLSIILISGNLIIRLLATRISLTSVALPLVIGKYSVGLILLTLLHPLLHGRFRRSSTVYTGAALLLLMVGSAIASVFSLILGVFFVIALVAGFLFSLSHNALLKTLFLAMAVLPGVYLLVSVTPVADQQTIHSLLIPALGRELVTAAFLLPPVLMFFRLDILVRKFPVLPVFGMVAGVVLAIAAAAVINTVTSVSDSTVRVLAQFPEDPSAMTGSIPEDGLITVIGIIDDGEVQVSYNDRSVLRCTTPPCSTTVPTETPPLRLSVQTGRALDRYTIRYSVKYSTPAVAVDIAVHTDHPVQLYAAAMPADVPPGDTVSHILFQPGPFPPKTHSGTVVLRDVPEGTRVTVEIHARFSGNRADVVYTGQPDHFVRSDFTQEWTIRSERTLQ